MLINTLCAEPDIKIIASSDKAVKAPRIKKQSAKHAALNTERILNNFDSSEIQFKS